MALEECCKSCDCGGEIVCLGDHWPPNTCLHGLAICASCAPGDCIECALVLGLAERGAA